MLLNNPLTAIWKFSLSYLKRVLALLHRQHGSFSHNENLSWKPHCSMVSLYKWKKREQETQKVAYGERCCWQKEEQQEALGTSGTTKHLGKNHTLELRFYWALSWTQSQDWQRLSRSHGKMAYGPILTSIMSINVAEISWLLQSTKKKGIWPLHRNFF